jgi:murein DD-endopeptidase MepM/ murein hydrolase activator NlpD
VAGFITAGVLVERGGPERPSSGGPAGWAAPDGIGAPPRPDAPAVSPGVVSAGQYVFPVAGEVSYVRSHHDYPATDIIAACGSTFHAVLAGVVLEVSRSDSYDARTDDGAERGGLFVSMLGDDGVRYYGSHLQSVARGIDAGVRVRAGQTLGAVGDSGHAGTCHLHFGMSPPCARTGDWWLRRGAVWPWSYLDIWRSGMDVHGATSSPAVAVAHWAKANGCPGAPR